MTSILKSGETGAFVDLTTTCTRPAPLGPGRRPAPCWSDDPMTYAPRRDPLRRRMAYRRCGASGLKLPAVSLGLWHNFGDDTPHETKRAICRTAFDLGITHFDLANNYGPPPGSAEEAFGEILGTDFRGHRDELVISTKAGYRMWPGPYGEWGSRKYLLASPRPEPQAHGPRLRRHLLLPPLRPLDAARGDDGRPRRRRPLRQGALRRPLLLQLRQAPAPPPRS